MQNIKYIFTLLKLWRLPLFTKRILLLAPEDSAACTSSLNFWREGLTGSGVHASISMPGTAVGAGAPVIGVEVVILSSYK